MSETLYRKYRPQTFSDLTGQNHIKITLENEIITGKIAHAYLFCGPRGIGKTTSARLFAKAINCANRKPDTAEPCNECDSCREITLGRSLDVMEVDAASHTGVDNVRENIIENARFAPSRLKYKVFIIDEVHMLSTSAFNALLKTLEEPPAHAIFILATTEIHKVPATIISRCQRFDFRKINITDLVERLNRLVAGEGIEVDRKVLERIARESEGCLRDAESLLGQVLALGGGRINLETVSLVLPASDFSLVFTLIKYIALKNASGGVKFINQLVLDGIDLNQFVLDTIDVLRKILLFKVDESLGNLSLEYDEAMERELREVVAKFDTREILSVIEVFLAKKPEIKTSAIPQFPLELGVVELCLGASVKSNDEAIGEIKIPARSRETVYVKKPDSGERPAAPESSPAPGAMPAPKPVFDVGETVGVDLETIKNRWGDVVSKVTDYNASLPISVSLSRPLALEGNLLRLGTNYKFHKDRLTELKNKILLEKVLDEIFCSKILTATDVVKDEAAAAEEAVGAAANNLAAEFGGRVI